MVSSHDDAQPIMEEDLRVDLGHFVRGLVGKHIIQLMPLEHQQQLAHALIDNLDFDFRILLAKLCHHFGVEHRERMGYAD